MGIKILQKKRHKKRKNLEGKLIIGVVGTHIGVGTTHFSILLSNYISACLGRRTAYIECSPQNELIYMEEAYCSAGNATSINNPFSLYKVEYYKNAKEKKIAEIMGYGYDCIVLDIGLANEKMKSEFFRCDKKIVISSLAPWKYFELENFLAKVDSTWDRQHLEYGISFTKKEIVREVSKDYEIPIFQIPYEPDPFAISTDTIKMFERII